MKMSLISHANKTYIHMNGFELDLGLKRRLRAIACPCFNLVCLTKNFSPYRNPKKVNVLNRLHEQLGHFRLVLVKIL